MQIFEHDFVAEFEKIIDKTIYKFKTTYCSSCGATFGPGNSGFSHCRDHEGLKSRNTWDNSED